MSFDLGVDLGTTYSAAELSAAMRRWVVEVVTEREGGEPRSITPGS